jgi:hypothetical protein
MWVRREVQDGSRVGDVYRINATRERVVRRRTPAQ